MFQFNIQIHIEQMGIRLAPAYSKTQKSIEFKKKKNREQHTHVYYIPAIHLFIGLFPANQFAFYCQSYEYNFNLSHFIANR